MYLVMIVTDTGEEKFNRSEVTETLLRIVKVL